MDEVKVGSSVFDGEPGTNTFEIPSDGLRRALRDLKDAQDAVVEAQGRLFYLQQRRDQAKRVVEDLRDARAALLLSREQLRVRGDLPTGVLLPVEVVIP